MVEIKCRTIPEPPNGTRPVYRKNNDKKNSSKDIGNSKDEPFIQGSYGEELDYICGNCGHLLAEDVSQGEISVDTVFQCSNCQAYNETYNVESRPVT
jgi:DNA-directed RNA polymerase subunit RPC12/RpoP